MAIISELSTGGFFFAMRSCENSQAAGERKTKTVSLDGITFWSTTESIIPHMSDEIFLAARVIVRFDDQKNSTQFDHRTQERTTDPILFPVKIFASLVSRIYRTVPNPSGHTTIDTFHLHATTSRITAKLFLETLRSACRLGGCKEFFGFSPCDIGTKSIRSGAAMALFLNGHSREHIMLLDRWRSAAFMDYIRPKYLNGPTITAPT